MINTTLDGKGLAIGCHGRIVRCRTGNGVGSACCHPTGVLIDGKAVARSTKLARGISALHVAIAVARSTGAGTEAVATVALGSVLGAKILIAGTEAGAVLERHRGA
jgi:hypothetical protein